MSRWTGSSLIQVIIAWGLFRAKPLSVTMLNFCLSPMRYYRIIFHGKCERNGDALINEKADEVIFCGVLASWSIERCVDPLGSGRCGSDFKVQSLNSCYGENVLWNCSHVHVAEHFDDKSSLVQVMDWCRQATSHYLNKCLPRFMSCGINRPQWFQVIICRVLAILVPQGMGWTQGSILRHMDTAPSSVSHDR